MEEARDPDEIELALAHHLVSDVDVAALGVTSLRWHPHSFA
jgi:hypothetical protein